MLRCTEWCSRYRTTHVPGKNRQLACNSMLAWLVFVGDKGALLTSRQTARCWAESHLVRPVNAAQKAIWLRRSGLSSAECSPSSSWRLDGSMRCGCPRSAIFETLKTMMNQSGGRWKEKDSRGERQEGMAVRGWKH